MTSSLLRVLAAGATRTRPRADAEAPERRTPGDGVGASRRQASSLSSRIAESAWDASGATPGQAGRRLDVSSEAMMLGLASLARRCQAQVLAPYARAGGQKGQVPAYEGRALGPRCLGRDPRARGQAETGVPEGSTMRRVLAAMAIGMGCLGFVGHGESKQRIAEEDRQRRAGHRLWRCRGKTVASLPPSTPTRDPRAWPRPECWPARPRPGTAWPALSRAAFASTGPPWAKLGPDGRGQAALVRRRGPDTRLTGAPRMSISQLGGPARGGVQ
jgi:hypothetical protein